MPAFAAGAFAIDVNTALLALSDALGLPTAHGGLLRLLQLWGLPWRLPVRPTSGPVFPTGFHIAVGLRLVAIGIWAALLI